MSRHVHNQDGKRRLKIAALTLGITASLITAVAHQAINSTGGIFDVLAEKTFPRTNRFYSMDEKLEKALQADARADVIRLATEYLKLADEFEDDWNYGNAVHDANAALGLVAIMDGKPQSAAEYLLKAGNSPGSPQMNSFGPDLQLADMLLACGERKVVIEYLNLISKFWAPEARTIPAVIAKIERGEVIELNEFDMCCHGE